jgi:DNA-binding NarL/FixJ family response regulator
MDLIPELRAANPEGQVLVLTASASRDELARAVDAGAAGVMHKSSGLNEIIDAVQRLSRGEHITDPNDMIDLLRLANRQRVEAGHVQTNYEQLTPREVEVLAALAEGLSDKEIAERLYIGTETVRTHMAKILDKLGVHSRLQAVLFAVRHGLVELK